ncbi:MAG: hypothetical protein KIT24_11560 [Phycisphaeraceae bacterium]|nr:hypothetical protein [Phycisphaeraceae bacterium]
MNYFENDPMNPTAFNPSGTQNTAYYERLADEQRRRDEQNRQISQRKEYERQQAELFEEQRRREQDQERQRRQFEEHARQQEQHLRAMAPQQPVAHGWGGTRPCPAPATSYDSQSPAGIIILGVLLVGVIATIVIPYQLGVGAGFDQRHASSPLLLVVRALAAGGATAAALIAMRNCIQTETSCPAGIAIACLLGCVAGFAGFKSASMLVCYIVMLSAGLALTFGVVSRLRNLKSDGQVLQDSIRETWGWAALLLATVMVIAFAVGFLTADRYAALSESAKTAMTQVSKVLRLPEMIGGNAAKSQGWAAGCQLLFGALVAAVWSAVGWFYGALVSPSRIPALVCGIVLGIAALMWTVKAALL